MDFLAFKSHYCPSTPPTEGVAKVEGWNSQSPALVEAIKAYQPESIVEVGSWLGASALFMASLTKSPILCVDTFLGSNEILWRQGNVSNLTADFDSLFRQFCTNITAAGLNAQISPLPMTSSSAAELLSAEGVQVDMVYIDAGHREREVYADLNDWAPLTRKIVVGDDYNHSWPGVIAAADRFALEQGLKLKVIDSKFLIEIQA